MFYSKCLKPYKNDYYDLRLTLTMCKEMICEVKFNIKIKRLYGNEGLKIACA